LAQRHPPDQIGDAVGGGDARVAPGLGALDRHRVRVVWRRTSSVASVTWVVAGGSSRIRRISISIAWWPIARIGCWMVVSGGSQRADSGMLSKPTTDRSPGTLMPSSRATSIVAIADVSLAANTAVGGSSPERSSRAASADTGAL